MKQLCKISLFLSIIAVGMISNISSADATVIYIDGKAGTANMSIQAGTYRGSLIGGAWNAWGGSVEDGRGWLNNWGASIPGNGTIFQGTGVYDTPIAAYHHAQDIYFTVPQSGTMVFTNGDPKQLLADNVGGTSISITKSLGDAKKDRWQFASDIANYASQVATIVSVAVAATAAAPAVLATFVALGLAAAALALLGGVGGTTGSVIAALINIRDLIFEAVKASYLGSPFLTSAVKLSLAGLAATAVSLGAAWMAGDPPNFDYKTVPVLQGPVFLGGSEDDAYANNTLEIVDTWRVSIDAFERYQGAVIDGEQGYAALQMQAYQDSLRLIERNMTILSDKTGSLIAQLDFDNITNTPEQGAYFKEKFVTDPLPAFVTETIHDMGMSDAQFKAMTLTLLSQAPSLISSDEASLFLGQGFSVPLASVREIDVINPVQIPEPGVIWLCGSAGFAWLLCRRRHRHIASPSLAV